MSKLLGGLFSRPSGKASGLVFGSGRTSRGKQVTAREYVIPTDPKTNAQQEQRGKMPFSTAIIQAIGRSIYQFDWNRAINNLPGFQSLSSLFMRNIAHTSGELSTPGETSLGARHFPDTFSAEDDTTDIDVSWSTENGDVGADDDIAVVVAVATDPESESVEREVIVDTSTTRTDGGVTLTGAGTAPGDMQVMLYFKAAGSGIPANDRKSSAKWTETVSP